MTEPTIENPMNEYTVYETLDAEKATTLLNKNPDNRNLVPQRVEAIAADMLAGNFRVTNQGIGIDRQGNLTDGQHRLWAIIEADRVRPGFVQRIGVTYNLSIEARDVTDIGYTRSKGEKLRRMGVAHSKKVVSIINSLNILRTGTHNHVLTPDMLASEYEFYKEAIDWAVEAFPSSRKTDQARIVAAFVLAYRLNPEKVKAMCQPYREGTGLQNGDPAQYLRFYVLERLPQMTDDRLSVMIKTLGAIQAQIEGKQIYKLYPAAAHLDYFMEHDNLARIAGGLSTAAKPIEKVVPLKPVKIPEEKPAAPKGSFILRKKADLEKPADPTLKPADFSVESVRAALMGNPNLSE